MTKEGPLVSSFFPLSRKTNLQSKGCDFFNYLLFPFIYGYLIVFQYVVILQPKYLYNMMQKEKDIVIRQQRLLLKARVAIAYGETALLDEIERELESLSMFFN